MSGPSSDPPRPPLPAACSLGSLDGAARRRRWQALGAASPPHARRIANRLEVRWRLDDDGARELAALVAAERECCAFVAWSLRGRGAERILTVAADPERPDDIAAIAALFGSR